MSTPSGGDGTPLEACSGRQVDGSWIGVRRGVPLYLPPEANEQADALLRQAAQCEPDLTALMRAVERRVRNRCPQARLLGPDEGTHRKTELSLKTKLVIKTREEPRPGSWPIDRIRDAVRYAFVLPDADYAAVARWIRDDLADCFTGIKWKNAWTSHGYRGINSSWREAASGQKFEVQFHTPASHRAEEDSHDLHVAERLDRIASEPDRTVPHRLAAIYRAVPEPPGARRLHCPTAPDRGRRRRWARAPSTSEVERLARRRHGGQTDKAGRPYTEHLAAVAGGVRAHGGSAEQVAAAWLHDAVEDDVMCFAELDRLGLAPETAAIVRAVTKRCGEELADYARRVAGTPGALLVKRQDIAHNADPSRLSSLAPDQHRRLADRYRAMERLLAELAGEDQRGNGCGA
ncbi:hypothetical protein GCM10027174_42240 [Salinifilum aidingensis]